MINYMIFLGALAVITMLYQFYCYTQVEATKTDAIELLLPLGVNEFENQYSEIAALPI